MFGFYEKGDTGESLVRLPRLGGKKNTIPHLAIFGVKYGGQGLSTFSPRPGTSAQTWRYKLEVALLASPLVLLSARWNVQRDAFEN